MLPASSNWRRESEILVNYEGTANGSSNFGAAKSKCGGDAKASLSDWTLDSSSALTWPLLLQLQEHATEREGPGQ